MKLVAGTSGYAFKEWKGSFYPPDMKDAGMLAHYASKFPAVEINNTFYRLPKEDVLAGWASQVPDTFMFAIKASQRITHHARLKPESAGNLEYLLKATEVMGDRLGPILFQLPPNLKKDVPRLRAFLAMLPADRKFTVEFRHDSWFDDETYDALRERDVPMCIIEQPDFASPVVATASWGYVRLHRFDYDAAMLAAWSEKIVGQAWAHSYVFFKHDEGIGSGPPAVGAFLDEIRPRLVAG